MLAGESEIYSELKGPSVATITVSVAASGKGQAQHIKPSRHDCGTLARDRGPSSQVQQRWINPTSNCPESPGNGHPYSCQLQMCQDP
jgi:hypothetical protein